MLTNYLKTAFRNLLKNKFTSAVNLLGLIVGMTAAILIWQYVAYEKSYDDFHKNADRIVRVQTDRIKDGEVFLTFAAGAAGAGPVIHRNFPEVENYAKLTNAIGIYSNDTKFFKEKNAYYASNSFFDIFTSPLSIGDQKNCLAEPHTVCISQSIAKKYFGTNDPLGEILQFDGDENFKVTGVFPDWQEASHMKPEILLSYETVIQSDTSGQTETQAYWDGFYAYLLLKEGTDIKELEAKIPTALAATYEEDINKEIAFLLQPLKDIHLHSHLLSELEVNGDATAVRFMLIIGAIMLLIAWFNYLNLATARSTTRAREVGVRKVIGSSRASLIWQFLLETALINVIAIGVSLLLVQLLMPAFEVLAGKSISFSIADHPSFWLSIIGLFLVGTLLVGIYPALVLSSFRPSEALSSSKGIRKGAGGGMVRKILVVAQFAASVILIVGTLIIFQQLSHLQNTDLGININQTIVLDAPDSVDSTFHGKYDAFKKEMNQLAAVKSITASSEVPGSEVSWTAAIKKWGGDDDSYEGMQALAIDPMYGEQYGLEVIAGRLLSEEITTDLNAVLLNEKGVQRMNLGSPEEAVGVDLDFWDDQVKVVGVVKNFHQQSPKLTF